MNTNINTREEAIEYLTHCGLDVGERYSNLTETTQLFARLRGDPLDRGVFIYPYDGLWSFYYISPTDSTDNERNLPLREACDAAIKVLRDASTVA